MAGATENLLFTTGVYIAPLRDLMTVAKSVGTTAVLSDNRVRLGVGVGWCKEEFEQTGQDFATRGKRLDEMIVALRALWAGGWVEHHGEYYDVPAVPDGARPHRADPDHRRRPLPRGAPAHGGTVRRLDRRRRLQRGGGVDAPGRAARRAAEGRARDEKGFAIYLSLNERPDVDLYRRFADAGVTDFVCAPWMFADVAPGTPDEEALDTRLGLVRWFADEIIAKV